jgi:mRNA interferase RelE/StbE
VTWTVEYAVSVRKPVRRLHPEVRKRIRAYLEQRVAMLDDPRKLGGPLEGSRFAGLWRYRVGDYRIIVDIKDAVLVVLVIDIDRRSSVYR